MYKIWLLSIVSAFISVVVTDMSLFEPLRIWGKKTNKYLGGVLSCGFCFGVWVSASLTAIYQPRLFVWFAPIDYIITAFVIAYFSAIQWGGMAIMITWLDERKERIKS